MDNGQACEHKDAPRQAKYKRVEVYNSGWRIRKGWYICHFPKQDFKTLQSLCQVYLIAKDQRFTIYILFCFRFTVCTKSTCLYGFDMYFPRFVLYVYEGWYYVYHFWMNKEYACSFNNVNLPLKCCRIV